MSTYEKNKDNQTVAPANPEEALMDLEAINGMVPQAGEVAVPAQAFTGFQAALAVPPRDDAPLIFDIVYDGKVFLVAFALAHAQEGQLVVSPMNEQLWAPLRLIGGENVFQSMFGETVEDVETCLAGMKNHPSGTHFLMMSNSIETIQRIVRRLHIVTHGSVALH